MGLRPDKEPLSCSFFQLIQMPIPQIGREGRLGCGSPERVGGAQLDSEGCPLGFPVSVLMFPAQGERRHSELAAFHAEEDKGGPASYSVPLNSYM